MPPVVRTGIMIGHLVIRAMVPLRVLATPLTDRVGMTRVSPSGPTMALQAANVQVTQEVLVKTQATEVLELTTRHMEVTPETTTKANRDGAANLLLIAAPGRVRKDTDARMIGLKKKFVTFSQVTMKSILPRSKSRFPTVKSHSQAPLHPVMRNA